MEHRGSNGEEHGPPALRAGAVVAALLGLGALCGAQEGAPAGQAARVVVVPISGPIDVGTQSLVHRALRTARPGRDTLVVELDTPGGAVDRMWQIGRAIDRASQDGLETIAWVNREATSAGSFVAMSCDRLYMVRSGNIGSATPIIGSPLGTVTEIPEGDLREKAYSKMRSDFRAWAEAHGYPPALAEAMVDRDVEVVKVYEQGVGERIVTDTELQDLRERNPDGFTRIATLVRRGDLLNLTAEEAVELGFADGIRDTLDELLDKEGLRGQEVVAIENTRSEELASLLDSVKWLLLILALVLAYIEIKVPGFGLPGIAAILCFAVFLFGHWLVGLADVPHLVAVGAGLVLVAVELFVMPGALWPGVLGAFLVVGGLVMATVGPPSDLAYPLGRRFFVDESFRMVVAGLLAVLAGGIVTRVLPRTPVGKLLILRPAGDPFAAAVPEAESAAEAARPRAGDRGLARTDLRPVGKVALEREPGRDREARAAGVAIDAGARVRVVEVVGGRLVVEAEEELS